MTEIDDKLRALLKLPEGVVLSDEERAKALGKAKGDAAKAEIIKGTTERDTAILEREKDKKPRKFGGMR